MLYVLEGCDGAGKTTIAKQLAPILDAQIIHCSAETPNDYDFFTEIVMGGMDKDIIVDRFCYGQFVYQNPDERRLSDRQLFQLEAEMMNTGAKVIWVYADSKTLMDRLIYRGEKTSLPVETINQRYKELFSRTVIRPIIWRTDNK